MKWLLNSLICVALLLSCATPSLGQSSAADGAQNGQAGNLQIASVTGTLQGVASDRLMLKTEDGKDVFAVMSRKTTITYSGSAEASFLSPGMMVRFVTSFNTQTGVPQTPVTEVEIFRSVQKRRMTMEERQNQTPGIYPIIPGAAQNPRQGRTNRKQAPSAPSNPGAQQLKIVGQIRAAAADKLQVFAGNRPIVVQLDPQAEISIQAGDAMFCMPGDKISVEGLKSPSQEGWLQAESIEITGLSPLSPLSAKRGGLKSKNAGVKDKPAASTKTRKRSTRLGSGN